LTSSRNRRVGPLRLLVVGAFLVGLISSPLRSCFSHAGHGQVQHGTEVSAPHAAGSEHAGHPPPSDPSTDEGSHAGCECLGLCQLESAPLLSIASTAARTPAPVPSEPAQIHRDVAPRAGVPHAIPLARAPPTLA